MLQPCIESAAALSDYLQNYLIMPLNDLSYSYLAITATTSAIEILCLLDYRRQP